MSLKLLASILALRTHVQTGQPPSPRQKGAQHAHPPVPYLAPPPTLLRTCVSARRRARWRRKKSRPQMRAGLRPALALCGQLASRHRLLPPLSHPATLGWQRHHRTLPRFEIAQDARADETEALEDDDCLARVEALVDEWHALVSQQKFARAGTAKKRLLDLGVVPLPQYAVAGDADAASLDAAALVELLRGPPTLTAIGQLAQMGVRLERPPWRLKGASAEKAATIDKAAVLLLLEQWDELRLQRQFDEADELRKRLFNEWDITIITKGARRQYRLRGRADVLELGG